MLGRLLGGRYKLIEELGSGGFGQTYIAEDTQRPGKPKCVVKHLKPARQDPAFLAIARRMFNTEAKTLEKLGHHNQIPHLLAYFEENKQFYLVQEFIEGHPLSDELCQNKQLSEAEVIDLLQDLLGILEFVHSYQVIHRDIKPNNLIRRQQDGKLVLIDFGAVKEIHTQLATESGQSSITVGIGTQGYVPSEQLAGKPRYSSDLYALGITAIQALTGAKPSQLPEDPETCEIIWRDKVKVSDRLAEILDKMVRYHVRERYQSATEVSLELQQLQQDLSAPTDENPFAKTRKRVSAAIAIAITSMVASGLVLGARQMGGVESLELAAFDQMVRLRYLTRTWEDLDRKQPMEGPDSRLLVVEINDADIAAQEKYPLTDRVLNQLLKKLESYNPRAIGLDIYRDLPVPPGYPELEKTLQTSDRIITVCKMSNQDNPGIAPPKAASEDSVGFNDLVIDPDNKVRRSLLFANDDNGACKTSYSFGAQLALHYLEKEGIQAEGTPEGHLKINSTIFKRLKHNFGAYQNADSGGYQIVLDYRSAHNIAPQVTLSDVLTGEINPNLVKDRIVIIGVTSSKKDNAFYTSYGGGRKMFGVLVQAQVISQILGVVLDNRPLIWDWSEWVEMLWIAGWGLGGAVLVWKIRRPLVLIVGGTATLGVIFFTGFYLFTQGGWVPVAAPALAVVANGSAFVLLRLYRSTQKHFQDTKKRKPPTSADNQPKVDPIYAADTLPLQEVSFLSGAETTVGGSLDPHQCQPYSVNGTKGQLLTVKAQEGNVNIEVIAPNGETVGKVSERSHWQGILPTDGDYKVKVYAADASVYAVSLDVVDNTSAGSTAATIVSAHT
ncbi:CHASE2 domain-containing protein [Funiculus sociatus GB2-A5]|uniref:non-specific serine/threonine protein kinase n=1 Tax=Funiculus sociatus GB2-A5 TaxID=2933946 RepID=A0ABV0JPS1_9CYAN|nr:MULTISPECIES: CHASE2 domain-containing protein [unclassified Trichocoleus]MBD1907767.1 CHASE2 domain-containing protein [Trichocoleus sp. FACHB-832]MBD2065184.1 CHASE2 domain-containing protein [Trichocoleus sp. FACHB-6]